MVVLTISSIAKPKTLGSLFMRWRSLKVERKCSVVIIRAVMKRKLKAANEDPKEQHGANIIQH